MLLQSYGHVRLQLFLQDKNILKQRRAIRSFDIVPKDRNTGTIGYGALRSFRRFTNMIQKAPGHRPVCTCQGSFIASYTKFH